MKIHTAPSVALLCLRMKVLLFQGTFRQLIYSLEVVTSWQVFVLSPLSSLRAPVIVQKAGLDSVCMGTLPFGENMSLIMLVFPYFVSCLWGASPSFLFRFQGLQFWNVGQ